MMATKLDFENREYTCLLDSPNTILSGPNMASMQGVSRRLGRLWNMDDDKQTRLMKSSSWADVWRDLMAATPFY